jgi:hypothetical protein
VELLGHGAPLLSDAQTFPSHPIYRNGAPLLGARLLCIVVGQTMVKLSGGAVLSCLPVDEVAHQKSDAPLLVF